MVITDATTGSQISLLTRLVEVEKMVSIYLSRSHLPVYFDSETTGSKGSNKRTDKMVSLQFMQEGGSPVVIDVRGWENLIIGRHGIFKALHPLFQSALLIGVNLKFDYQMCLLNYGLRISKPWDCMIAEQVIYGMGFSDARSKNISFSFKAMGERRGLTISKEERETFKDMHLFPAWTKPFTQEQINYMAQDVRELRTIYGDQVITLHRQDKIDCAVLEMKVLPAVSEIELNGLLIDVPEWKKVIERRKEDAKPLEEELITAFGGAILEKRAKKIDEELQAYVEWEQARDTAELKARMAWCELVDKHFTSVHYGDEKVFYDLDEMPLLSKWGKFKPEYMGRWRARYPNPGKPKHENSLINISSPAQLMDAFEVMGIKAKNTSSQSLVMLVEEHPIIEKLLEWRAANKFIVSFGDSLLEKIEPLTGRLHPTLIQIGASSNRMSSENPNSQQFPKASEEENGVNIRKCIIAPEGSRILTADYSGQELLILAELSGDENMLRLLDEGKDLHSETARLMFGLNPDVDTKKHNVAPGVSARTAAKTINYGIAYGMTKYRLSKVLKCSLDTAQELIDAWFRAYPGVKRWLDSQKIQGERTLQTRTIAGWVRYLDPLPSEPVKKFGLSREEWFTWKDKHREWERLRGKLHNKAMNTPIQGAGAAMMKLAVSTFFQWTLLNGSKVKIIGVVHDEMVVEAPEQEAEKAAEALAECMDQAAHYFLKRVRVPRSTVSIEKFWSK